MDFPTYIKNQNQENYHEELNQTLRNGVGQNGFTLTLLTNTQLTQVLALDPPMPPGTVWFNTTVNAMQYLDNTFTVKTVTAT